MKNLKAINLGYRFTNYLKDSSWALSVRLALWFQAGLIEKEMAAINTSRVELFVWDNEELQAGD